MTAAAIAPAPGWLAAMPWAEMVAAWIVFAGNLLSPGPNVLNTIAIALGSGRRVAMAVVPAVGLGVLVWGAAAVLGAAALFQERPWLAPALSALGGGLLLWFAWRYAGTALRWGPAKAEGRLMAPREAFARTLGILATNPKALTTWLVLVSIFPVASASPAAMAVMIAGSVLVACACHAAYALLFSTRPAAAAYLRAGRWINAGVAVFFAGLGATLLLGATRALT